MTVMPIAMSTGREIAAAKAIAEALTERGFASDDANPTLASGTAGIVLFLTEYAVSSGDSRMRRAACEGARTLIDSLADVPGSCGLMTGFAGIATAILEVSRLFPDDFPVSGAEAIDEALADIVDVDEWPHHLDIFGGLAGTGVYALLRPETNSRTLHKIVSVLSETAERSADGITWFTPPRLLTVEMKAVAPEGEYNVGLAHGTAGILSFLCDCAALGVVPADNELLGGAARWLIAHTPDHLAPYAIRSGVPTPPARCAWCHGFPGISTALLKAGLITGDDALIASAKRSAFYAATLSVNEAGVVDGCFCHGAAGIAYIFDALARVLSSERLATAADRWTDVLLDQRRDEEGIAGFLTYDNGISVGSPYVADPTLLRGAAGIGLVLLSRLTRPATHWPSLLLLDFSQYACT